MHLVAKDAFRLHQHHASVCLSHSVEPGALLGQDDIAAARHQMFTLKVKYRTQPPSICELLDLYELPNIISCLMQPRSVDGSTACDGGGQEFFSGKNSAVTHLLVTEKLHREPRPAHRLLALHIMFTGHGLRCGDVEATADSLSFVPQYSIPRGGFEVRESKGWLDQVGVQGREPGT
eukprot:PhM_4_TR17083/c0_g1_i1/m.58518